MSPELKNQLKGIYNNQVEYEHQLQVNLPGELLLISPYTMLVFLESK